MALRRCPTRSDNAPNAGAIKPMPLRSAIRPPICSMEMPSPAAKSGKNGYTMRMATSCTARVLIAMLTRRLIETGFEIGSSESAVANSEL